MSRTTDQSKTRNLASATDVNLELFEPTLRLLAQASIPAGIEDRVHARLESQPQHAVRGMRWLVQLVGQWMRPASETMASSWMRSDLLRSDWLRGAAAATLAVAISGGGWVVYSNAYPVANHNGMSPLMTGGFGGANAMRRSQPLDPPLIVSPPQRLSDASSEGDSTSKPTKRSSGRRMLRSHSPEPSKIPQPEKLP